MGFNTADGRAELIAGAAQVNFDFIFKIYTNEDIVAWLTPSGQGADSQVDLLILDSDYTISINGDDGGIFTLSRPASAGDKVTLVRRLSPSRDIEYQNNGDLRAKILNLDQDYQTYLIADGGLSIEKSLRIPENDTLLNPVLPVTAKGQYLKVSDDGSKFEYVDIDTEIEESKAAAAAAANSAFEAAASEANAKFSEEASAVSAAKSKNSEDASAVSAAQAYSFAQGAFLTDETAYDLGYVADTFNLFPTDLGGLV